jgi:putative membrane protein
MKWFLIVAALLHLSFMIGELYPWSVPVSLKVASKTLEKFPLDEPLTKAQKDRFDAQQELSATIVHNAGIYNGILAGGLFWAAYAGLAATDVALVILVGAVVAGIFGTATLKSPATALQAAVGIVGLILVLKGRHKS